jgi:molybdopterin/thiamine biosynthesis adenylyltransferase
MMQASGRNLGPGLPARSIRPSELTLQSTRIPCALESEELESTLVPRVDSSCRPGPRFLPEAPEAEPYSYEEATARNLGLLTVEEQKVLRNSTVAIAGLGAVGGNYLLTLARMGVGGFVVCDPDRFEVVNLQRQAGAFSHTVGRGKAEVMAEMARAINPEVRIRAIPEALSETNAAECLRGADLALDGIDFFQIDARRLLFRAAREQGIYAITSGPIGYGASLQVFDPEGMTFDEYFGIGPEMTRAERMALFGAGLLPRIPRSGAMDAARVNFETEKGPALASSVMLCTGIMACEVLRILLGRGEPRCVPQAFYFDPYNREYVQARTTRNLSGLFRRLVRWVAFRRFPSLLRLHKNELAAAGRS